MSGVILPATLGRRLAGTLYDGLLVLAIWMMTALIEIMVTDALGVARSRAQTQALLFLVSFGFFGWSWTHGGQTLGARAWRMQVQTVDGGPIGWPTATLRFCVAVVWLPVGMLVAALRPDGRALHDVLAGTRVVVLPKDADSVALDRPGHHRGDDGVNP